MNPNTHLVPGTVVQAQGKTYTVTHLLDLGAVLARDHDSRQSVQLRVKDLYVPHAREGQPEAGTPTEDLSLISEEDWTVALTRYEAIKPLLEIPKHRRSKTLVVERAIATKRHWVTLYRWIEHFERTGRVSALLPEQRSDFQSSRLQDDVETIITAAIEEVYLKPERPPVQAVYDLIKKRCLAAKLPAPHPNTVRNRVNDLDDPLRMKKRFGARAADNAFGAQRGAFEGATYPLSVVQIDHTLMDIELVDDDQRLPIGRPWITLALDVYSRMIIGVYLSLDPPSADSVSMCLINAMLPKDALLGRYGIATPWMCWGKPVRLDADNAREFRSEMLDRACAEYGIDLQWRPIARPRFGTHVERLMGTVLRKVHTLPGTTFSNPQQRGDYDSEERAVMTLAELEHWLLVFIVEVYHQRFHRGIGTSPAKRFEEGILGSGERPGTGLPLRIMPETRLILDFTPSESRIVRPNGVTIDHVTYYHDVLRPYINRLEPGAEGKRRKHRFVFKRNPRDISQVHFYDPESREYHAIPYRNLARPSITVWELRAVIKALKEQGVKEIDEDAVFRAHDRMHAIVTSAGKSTKKKRRERQRGQHHRTRTPQANGTAAGTAGSAGTAAETGAVQPTVGTPSASSTPAAVTASSTPSSSATPAPASDQNARATQTQADDVLLPFADVKLRERL